MNRKPIYWTCGVLMVLSMGLSAAAKIQFAGLSPEQYVLTIWTYLDVFCAKPVFYLCLGLVCALRLFGRIDEPKLRLLSLIGGMVLTLSFGVIAVCSILNMDFTLALFAAMRHMFKTPGMFLVPGILLGLGLKD